MSNVVISKDFTFEASHVLPRHPGKCSRLHGHSWQLTVAVAGPVNAETGFVVDYGVLKGLVMTHIISKLDHAHLGHGSAMTAGSTGHLNTSNIPWPSPFGPDFYPSSENLVIAIGKILQPLVKELAPNVRLYSVSLKETCTSAATWRPDAE